MKARLKVVLKYLLGAFFVVAGVNHFIKPDFYLRMMPPYLPSHAFLVMLSGVLEALAGVLLLIPKFQRVGAWLMVALLLAVFPANVYMATHRELFADFSAVALWIRLPLQGVLIAWAYWYTRADVRRESLAS